MAIQPEPPIQLDPSMDNGHQLAFINQNFNSISNFLKTNSFKILQSNSFSLSGSFSSHGASSSGNDEIAAPSISISSLGLTSPPVVLFFVNNNGTYSQAVNGGLQDAGFTANSWYTTRWSAGNDTAAITFSIYRSWGTGVGGSISTFSPSFTIKYYLLQETAN